MFGFLFNFQKVKIFAHFVDLKLDKENQLESKNALKNLSQKCKGKRFLFIFK